MGLTFVVCRQKPQGDLSGEDLTLGKRYAVLETDDAHGMIRIVDDSGEDYLYPVGCFAPVMPSDEWGETPCSANAPPE